MKFRKRRLKFLANRRSHASQDDQKYIDIK